MNDRTKSSRDTRAARSSGGTVGLRSQRSYPEESLAERTQRRAGLLRHVHLRSERRASQLQRVMSRDRCERFVAVGQQIREGRFEATRGVRQIGVRALHALRRIEIVHREAQELADLAVTPEGERV